MPQRRARGLRLLVAEELEPGMVIDGHPIETISRSGNDDTMFIGLADGRRLTAKPNRPVRIER